MYPFINIFGNLFPTYGLCMLIGIAIVVSLATFKGKKTGVDFDSIIIVSAIGIFGAVLCGYLLYIFITYSPSGLWNMILNGDFRFLKNIGIVFYGGLIGGIAGVLIAVRITKSSISALEQVFVPFVPLGHAVGRVGCALAGCCHGMEYDGPIAIYYPNSITGLPPDVGYFPVQFLEAILDIFICLILVYYCKKERRKYQIISAYLAMYAVMRFITECFRGDSIRGVYFYLSTSQWISLGILVFCFIAKIKTRRTTSAKI